MKELVSHHEINAEGSGVRDDPAVGEGGLWGEDAVPQTHFSTTDNSVRLCDSADDLGVVF